MSRIRNNIIANYAGACWGALMSFIFIPWYIRYLGIEAYGIIGFFASIQTVLALMDAGLTATFSREIASMSGRTDSGQILRDLTRTFSTVYWGIAIAAGLLFAGLAPVFAHFWLKAEALSKSTITLSTLIMGLGIIARWPGNIYSGGLAGLQHMVAINVVNVVASTLRGLGTIGVLHFLSPTLMGYFGWHLVISILSTLTFKFLLWRRLPVGGTARFDLSLLKARWRFALGLLGNNLLGLLLIQLDKIVLSKILPLREFGYYALASTVGGIVYLALGPIVGAYFPRFVTLIAAHRTQDLAEAFHSACQLITVTVVPLGFLLMFFSREILQLWTHDEVITSSAHLVLSIIAFTVMINAFVHVPYQMQIAYRWTSLTFYYTIIALCFLGPMIYFLAKRYGMIGGAAVLALFSVSQVLLEEAFMFRRVLRGEMWRWYVRDIGLPLVVTGVYFIIIHWIVGFGTNNVTNIFILILVVGGAYVVALVAVPVTRTALLRRMQKYQETSFG